MVLPSDSARVTVEGLLKSMSLTGATSSSFRLLNALGEGARALESAACRPVGTPSKTNLLGASAAGAAGAVFGPAAAAAPLGALFLPSSGLGAGSGMRRTVYM